MGKVITASDSLCLRYYVAGDEEVLYEYTSDLESSKYLAREKHESIAQTKNMLLRLAIRTSLSVNDSCIWIIADASSSNALGYLTLVKARNSVEIHFGLLPAYRGKGHAKEAIKLATQYLLENMEVSEVVSFTDTTNLSAKSALEKAGFKIVGVKKEFYSAPLLPGKKRDVYWLRYCA
ncbi:GNAT family N-acetyltransferase [Reinekea forsetii]|nr:GNAT family N-acetyltransferase [Reinekea forsetii]